MTARRKKRVPSTAIERLRTGQMTESDARVAARLLGRPDLAEAAEAVSKATAWAAEMEKFRRGERSLGGLLTDEDDLAV